MRRSAPFHLIVAAVLATTAGCRRETPRAELPAATINGRTWLVDVANTPAQRYRGLSGRSVVPPGTGMLFMYPQPQRLEFCMRGCPMDLDIAFIGADMRVVRVHTMRAEADLAGRAIYASEQPAQFALEVAAGELGRADVTVGSKVAFGRQVPLPAKAEPGP